MVHKRMSGWALAGLVLGVECGGVRAQPADEWVFADWPIEEGFEELTGTRVLMPMPDAVPARRVRSPLDNRVDMVFLGDGYTAPEIAPIYRVDAAAVQASMFVHEPFVSYAPYFNFWVVDVVSNQSGVDHDPTYGVLKDTALDAGYWCAGIQRLLCVDINKAWAAATGAGLPDVDQIIVLANSGTYGGAGYGSSAVATAAGHNAQAVQIVEHELGHSFGGLADEYDYADGATWTGPEVPEANVSIYNGTQMIGLQTKWWPWLGDPDPAFDPPVGIYVGADYYQFGINRPSPNSVMRALNRPFNGPSAQEIIEAIYTEVSPIDGFSPPNATPVQAFGGQMLMVIPMQPVFHSLTITWDLDGLILAGFGNALTVDPSVLPYMGGGLHVVTATVQDPTPWVRDPVAIATLLTDAVSWTIIVPCGPSDLDLDGDLDLDDLDAFINAFLSGDLLADLDGNGSLNLDDVDLFIQFFLAGCP